MDLTRQLLAVILVFALASVAAATVSADPPGPDNRKQGNQVPDGTCTGRMEGAYDSDGAQSGWKLILTESAVDEDGEPGPDCPAGTVLFFQPPDIEGSGENQQHGEDQANAAEAQHDDDNQVDVSGGEVTDIRTEPPRTGDIDNRGDG